MDENRENKQSVMSANFLHNIIVESDLSSTVTLLHNSGAAVHLTSVRITFVNTNITGNVNGALIIRNSNGIFNGLTRITSNTQFNHVFESNIVFSGITRISRNSGGGILALSSIISFEKDIIFEYNNDPYLCNGGALNCQDGRVSFQGNTLFIKNSADCDGGAIYAVSTSIYMQGIVNFTLNTASNGGAMYLDNGASLIFKPNTSLYTSYNTALEYGGVIYHVDNPSISQCNKDAAIMNLPFCFLQEESYSLKSNTDIYSLDDKAKIDGNYLYGGLLDRCKVENALKYSTAYNFFNLAVHSKESRITSKPYELCICQHAIDCQQKQSVQVYRGQKFIIPLLANAQVGTTSTTVTAITSSKAKLEIY